jgi:hypothetical protein
LPVWADGAVEVFVRQDFVAKLRAVFPADDGLGDDGRLVMFVGLPEHHLDIMKREVLPAKKLHVFIVESGFPALALTLHNPLPVNIRHAVALVPEGFWLFLKLPAGVNDHHAPAMSGGLLVSKQPDERKNAGVVEKLIGQHDDGVEPVVLQNPAADFALSRSAVAF